MRQMSNRRALVMTRTERSRLAFLTSTHVPMFGLLADSYGLTAALGAIAAFPAAACVLTFLLRDPRAPRAQVQAGTGPLT